MPEPVTDRRPTTARDLHTTGLPDGRYLLRHNDNVLRDDPADPQLLQSHLQSCLDNTIRQFREDNDPNYTYARGKRHWLFLCRSCGE